eukprot:2681298-Alexandrium_andersonii.AAC.1
MVVGQWANITLRHAVAPYCPDASVTCARAPRPLPRHAPLAPHCTHGPPHGPTSEQAEQATLQPTSRYSVAPHKQLVATRSLPYRCPA